MIDVPPLSEEKKHQLRDLLNRWAAHQAARGVRALVYLLTNKLRAKSDTKNDEFPRKNSGGAKNGWAGASSEQTKQHV